MSKDSEGMRLVRAFLQAKSMGRRRTAIGLGLLLFIFVEKLSIDIWVVDGSHWAVGAGILVLAGLLGLDYFLEGLIKLRIWLGDRVIVVRLFPGDQERKD